MLIQKRQLNLTIGIRTALMVCTIAFCSGSAMALETQTVPIVGAVETVVANNREIADLFIADQQDRKDKTAGILTREQVWARDAQRRALALQLHKDGRLRTKDDLESAAMIFHHGTTADDYRLAFALATAAAAKSENPTETSRLMAFSLDRWLVSIKRPQWYGSQYETDGKTLSPIDMGAVDDAERRRLRIFVPELGK